MLGLTKKDLFLLEETLNRVFEVFDSDSREYPYFDDGDIYFNIRHTNKTYEGALLEYITFLKDSQTEEEFWGKKNIYYLKDSDEQVLKNLVSDLELSEMPFYINDENLFKRAFAQWRLKIGK